MGSINRKFETKRIKLFLWFIACSIGTPAVIILIMAILFFIESKTYVPTKLSGIIEIPFDFSYEILYFIGLEQSVILYLLSFFLPYIFIGFIIGGVVLYALLWYLSSDDNISRRSPNH